MKMKLFKQSTDDDVEMGSIKSNDPYSSLHLMNKLQGETGFLQEKTFDNENRNTQNKKIVDIKSYYSETSEKLLKMDPRSFDLLRHIENPSENIKDIVVSTLLSLNIPESETRKWEDCKSHLKLYTDDGILSRIRKESSIKCATNEEEKVRSLLKDIDLNDVKRESTGAAALYVWNKSALHYFENCSGDDTEETGA